MIRSPLRVFAWRSLVFGSMWIVLAGWDGNGWPLAVMVVLAAAYVSLRTLPPEKPSIRVGGALRFIPFFVLYSARGGVDVAIRAVRRSPDLQPGTVAFTTHLPPGGARTFFTAVIGLLPGTLTAGLNGDQLQVHVLDRRIDPLPQLQALEARVVDLYGERREGSG